MSFRNTIAATLGFQQAHDHGHYLGFPSQIGKNKQACFAFIKDKVWKSLSSWYVNSLSRAGRSVLLKAVASAIPIYAMGVALLPDLVCEGIEKMMNGFFLANVVTKLWYALGILVEYGTSEIPWWIGI